MEAKPLIVAVAVIALGTVAALLVVKSVQERNLFWQRNDPKRLRVTDVEANDDGWIFHENMEIV